jgi:hypothetical protein
MTLPPPPPTEAAMLPSTIVTPLPSAAVHVLTVLAVLLPFLVAGARWAIRRGAAPLRAWTIGAALLIAAWLAVPASVELGEPPRTSTAPMATRQPPVAQEEAVEGLLIGWICLVAVTAAALRPRATA